MARQDKQVQEEPETIDFCAKCYSLKIKYEDSIGLDCCEDCGCTDFKTATFEEWENMYERRYGHKFLEDTGDIRKSPIFQMSDERLKQRVFNDPSWRLICLKLYPSFPRGLSKADSVVLLFARLYQENRLDELRMELINQDKK